VPSLRPPPDLQTQFEDLLNQVWDLERRARMMDRIEAQTRDVDVRPRRRRRRRSKDR